MSKRFKLRIARVLPSFHTCRSKDLITAISNPINPKSLDLTFPSSSSSPSLIKRHVSSALVSVGCRFRSSSSSSSSKSNPPIAAAADPTPTSDFQWQKNEKWHVIAKVPAHHRRTKISSYHMNSSSDDEYSNYKAKTKTKKKKSHAKKIKRKKKSLIHRSSFRFSSSSFDNSWFSSSDRECGFIRDDFLETDTLISSSRSFSDDEEKRNPPLLRGNGGFKRIKTARRKNEQRLTCPSPEIDSPARLSVFRRMVSCGSAAATAEGGKVKESFAVVKRSEDPYGDFRRSMLEMILEKEMYEREDLEQLLHCFLSLNSRAHHAVIVQAFSEIWEILFGGRSDGAADAGTEGEGGARMRSL